MKERRESPEKTTLEKGRFFIPAAPRTIDGFATRAGATPAQARHHFCEGQSEVDDGIEAHAPFFEQPIKCLRLRDGARKSVQQKTADTSQTGDALADHLDNSLVGNQFAALHHFQGRGKRRAALHKRFGGAKNIARGEMTGAPVKPDDKPCAPDAAGARNSDSLDRRLETRRRECVAFP